MRLDDVDAVAVTAGPGLAGALTVGVAAAKALALGLGVPLHGVNHLAAHVAVDILEHGPLPEPAMALLVSGGHSSLLLVPDVTADVRPLGRTIDDAAGEAFDKVARLLGLPFPGGPLDRPAGPATGTPTAIDVPPRAERTARPRAAPVRLLVLGAEDRGRPLGGAARGRRRGRCPVADVAASFQEAVVDVLTRKAVAACREHGVGHLLIGGGVAANSRLRALAAAALRRGRDRAAGARGRGCARTTAPWWPRSGAQLGCAAGRRRRSTCPSTPSLPVTTVQADAAPSTPRGP